MFIPYTELHPYLHPTSRWLKVPPPPMLNIQSYGRFPHFRGPDPKESRQDFRHLSPLRRNGGSSSAKTSRAWSLRTGTQKPSLTTTLETSTELCVAPLQRGLLLTQCRSHNNRCALWPCRAPPAQQTTIFGQHQTICLPPQTLQSPPPPPPPPPTASVESVAASHHTGAWLKWKRCTMLDWML